MHYFLFQIIFTLLITCALAAPFQFDTEKDDDELSFDDLHDATGDEVEKEEPVKVDKTPQSYIQKIPRKNHIKDGEELNKCLTEDPAKGHPHLVKTDIQDVAEVLITHTKTEPEHAHKFEDIPVEVQKDAAIEVKVETSTSVSVSTTVAAAAVTTNDEAPKAKLADIPLERKRRDSDRPTKVRLPKLKLGDKKKLVVEKKTEEEPALPKPEPIPIPLHEVAGFEKIKTIVKRDTALLIPKYAGFTRPKPVSEILKQKAENKKEE